MRWPTADRAATLARCFTLVISFTVLRDVVGWRNGYCLQRVRGPKISVLSSSHHPSGALPGSLSRHRDSQFHSAKDRPIYVFRRRKGRLRSVSSGVCDWTISPPIIPPISTDSVNHEEAEVVIVLAGVDPLDNASGTTTTRTGHAFVFSRAQGHQPIRRQRRRQRLRLQALAEPDLEAAGALQTESNVVEARSLEIEGVRPCSTGETSSRGTVDIGVIVAEGKGQQQKRQSGMLLTEEKPRTGDLETSTTGTSRLRAATSVLENPLLMTNHQVALFRQGHPGAVQEYAPEVPEDADADDDRFMRMALRLAEQAGMEGEVPIGAVLTETVSTTRDGRRRVLSTGRNGVERRRDASAHAEMLCLQAAAKARHNWRLTGATLYVTIEPCAMCLSAAQLFRVDRVVFGAPNPNLGACGGWVELSSQKHPFHELKVKGGVLAEQCALTLQGFFRSRRLEESASAGQNVADSGCGEYSGA